MFDHSHLTHHIRVLALNNQFSKSNNITNENENENFDQNNLRRNNYQDFTTQNIIEKGDGIIEKISCPINSQTQELEFKSKLPFLPRVSEKVTNSIYSDVLKVIGLK